MNADFEGVRWDTSFTRAYFCTSDSLYQVDWKFGARPRLLGVLPPVMGRRAWWFNPDSSCWQLCEGGPVGRVGTSGTWWYRVLQSNRDVTNWRIVRSDTFSCDVGDCADIQPPEAPWARRAKTVSVDDAAQEGLLLGWMEQAFPFDTATVAIAGPAGESGEDRAWHFIATNAAPHRGIAFRIFYTDQTLTSPPFFFVDLDQRTKRRIPTEVNEDWEEALLSEHCGLVLIPGAFGEPNLIDAEAGNTVLSREKSSGAVWVPPPRKR